MKTIGKISKILLSLVIMVTMFAASIPVVSADNAQSNVTVNRSYVMEDFIGDYDFPGLVTTDGVIVYCMEVDKNFVESNTVYTYSKAADAGLLWIIQNSYPNKSITGIKERDQYITQGAIWWYLDEINGVNKLSESFKSHDGDKEAYVGMRNEMIKLVNGGKQHRNDTQTSLAMTLTNNNTKLNLTSDKKYYESDYMTASITGATTFTVAVSGAKNIKVINEKGAIQTSYNSGEKFKIQIPASDITSKANITVKTTATGGKKSVATYTPSNTSFQSVVSTKINNETITKETTLTAEPVKVNPTCKVENGKYYGKNGNSVDKATYEKECLPKEEPKVCEIVDGKYYGKEGNLVDKETYNKECNSVVVPVPNTLANKSILALGLGVIIIASGVGLILYRKKLNS